MESDKDTSIRILYWQKTKDIICFVFCQFILYLCSYKELHYKQSKAKRSKKHGCQLVTSK